MGASEVALCKPRGLQVVALVNSSLQIVALSPNAHWGSPFINSQGTKQGRSCFLLKCLGQTEENVVNLVFEVLDEGESLLLQLKDYLI